MHSSKLLISNYVGSYLSLWEISLQSITAVFQLQIIYVRRISKFRNVFLLHRHFQVKESTITKWSLSSCKRGFMNSLVGSKKTCG